MNSQQLLARIVFSTAIAFTPGPNTTLSAAPDVRRGPLLGLLSVAYLRFVGAPRPAREHLKPLTICALGSVVGFPLFIAIALREVQSTHAAVASGVIPLGTAIVGALSFGQLRTATFGQCIGHMPFRDAGDCGQEVLQIWLADQQRTPAPACMATVCDAKSLLPSGAMWDPGAAAR